MRTFRRGAKGKGHAGNRCGVTFLIAMTYAEVAQSKPADFLPKFEHRFQRLPVWQRPNVRDGAAGGDLRYTSRRVSREERHCVAANGGGGFRGGGDGAR